MQQRQKDGSAEDARNQQSVQNLRHPEKEAQGDIGRKTPVPCGIHLCGQTENIAESPRPERKHGLPGHDGGKGLLSRTAKIVVVGNKRRQQAEQPHAKIHATKGKERRELHGTVPGSPLVGMQKSGENRSATLEHFQFEMLCASNHTACRFAEKRGVPLASGRAALCRRLAFHLFQR